MDLNETLIPVLETVGTVSFSVSGAMIGINKKLDILGVVILGVTTATGGGILRDTLIGTIPARAFIHPGYLLLSVAVALAVFVVAALLRDRYFRNQPLISTVNNIFDAAGLSVFTVAGINVGLGSPFADNMLLVVFLGVVTGVGGGMLRDMMIREIPFILVKRVYAVAAIAGGCAYYLLGRCGAPAALAACVCILVTFGIRMCATVFKWNLPRIR